MTVKVVTAQQMRAVEEEAARLGVPPSVLMEHAGRAVAEEVVRVAQARGAVAVLVLVGPGNNGGDGLVAARYLNDWGLPAVCYVWNRRRDADRVRDLASAAGVPLVLAEEDAAFARLREEVGRAGLVVDALLGTGLTRPLSADLRDLLGTVRAEIGERTVLAVDVPSGLNSDSGGVDEATLPADVTVSLGHLKVGLVVAPGAAYAGRVVMGDIGLPAGAEAQGQADVLDDATVRALLPPRRPYSHKGTYGKALVIAGSENYPGAAVLACRAATRVGTGLVSLGIGHGVQPLVAGALLETTYFPLPDADGGLAEAALERIIAAGEGYDAWLIGPGLGRRAGTVQLVRALVQRLAELGRGDAGAPRLVIDADGLNALAGSGEWWQDLGPRAVVTPHAGEMARLLGTTIQAVESDRLETARRAAQKWGLVVVLKGAYTVAIDPGGQAALCPVATPALATAGSGDILSGAMVGLAAQGLDAWDAARVAVYLHGRAGEAVAAHIGERGAVAGDLVPVLPQVLGRLGGPGRADTLETGAV